MMFILPALPLWAGVVSSFPAEQKPLTAPSLQKPVTSQEEGGSPALRKLQGRFLHITDVHPDAFYEAYSSTDSACHNGNGTAGILGAEMSGCDTPFSLVNATFQWINDHLKDKIDFVIWTGDSARHDNDEHIPRTEKGVVDLNKMVVEKLVEVFGKDDNIEDPDPTNDFVVPIVPTFGNNDILPHNIFQPGPNRWTRDYADIWRKFIPEAQRHSFARGGWFFTEVIPNKLAVFSLNTIYFFDSNSAVDGCDRKSEPGYEHMEWLRVQLQFLRERGMKAIMIGHVPPARTAGKQSWDESCWQKYSLWMRQYRDVVVTGIFGHMNIDHFMIQDAFDLKYNVRGELEELELDERNATDPMLSVQSKADYMTDLRDGWTSLPTPPLGMSYSELATGSDDEYVLKKDKNRKQSKEEKKKKFLEEIGGKWAERFSLSLVSPSVVPNYFPTLRVVEYNITAMENDHPAMGKSHPASTDIEVTLPTERQSTPSSADNIEDDESPIHDLRKHAKKSKHKKKKNRKKPSKPPFTIPKPPSSVTPPGPAYSPQPLTLISYTQYFANLTFINNDFEDLGLTLDEYIGTSDYEGQHNGTAKHPSKFAYDVEYDTRTDKRYKLRDMTVRSYMGLAQRIIKDTTRNNAQKHVLDIRADGSVVDVGGSEADVENSEDGAEQEYEQSEHGALNGKGKDKKKKHRKRKKKRKGKRGKGDETLWHTFVKRAFVMTKTDEDMEDFEPTYRER